MPSHFYGLKRGDIVLIVVAAAVALAIAIVFAFTGNVDGGASDSANGADGAATATPAPVQAYVATIKVDGVIWRSLSLDRDARVEYESDDGRHNVITVENGTVRMEDANCPDKLCVKQGPIKKTSALIVCLPNRVTVHIEKGVAIDAPAGDDGDGRSESGGDDGGSGSESDGGSENDDNVDIIDDVDVISG